MTEEEEEGERSRRRTEEDRRSRRRTEGAGGGKPASGGSFPLGLWRPPGLMSCALSLMSTLCDGYHLKLNNFWFVCLLGSSEGVLFVIPIGSYPSGIISHYPR